MNYLEKKKKAMLNSIASGGLPSEYQEVEWVGGNTTRSAYIDTNYFLTSDYTEYEIEFYKIGNVDSKSLFGGQQSNTFTGVPWTRGVNQNIEYYVGRYGGILPLYTTISNDLNTLKYTNTPNIVSVDYNGVTHIYTTSNNSLLKTKSIYLLSNNGGAGQVCDSNYRVKRFKITDNGNLERDFIPCYRKSDDVIGFYDLVYGTFYTNAGSGTFTKGNDV